MAFTLLPKSPVKKKKEKARTCCPKKHRDNLVLNLPFSYKTPLSCDITAVRSRVITSPSSPPGLFFFFVFFLREPVVLSPKCHPTTDWKILFFWYLVLYKCGILIQLSDSGRWAVNQQRCPETRALQNEVHSPTSTRAECVQHIRPVMHAHKCWLSWHAGLKDCRAPCSAWKCASQLVEGKLGLDSVASRERCLTSSHWVEEKKKTQTKWD